MKFADNLRRLTETAPQKKQDTIVFHRDKLVDEILEEFRHSCNLAASEGKCSCSYSPSRRGCVEGAYSLDYGNNVIIMPEMYNDWKKRCKNMQTQLANDGFSSVSVNLVPHHDFKTVPKMVGGFKFRFN